MGHKIAKKHKSELSKFYIDWEIQSCRILVSKSTLRRLVKDCYLGEKRSYSYFNIMQTDVLWDWFRSSDQASSLQLFIIYAKYHDPTEQIVAKKNIFF